MGWSVIGRRLLTLHFEQFLLLLMMLFVERWRLAASVYSWKVNVYSFQKIREASAPFSRKSENRRSEKKIGQPTQPHIVVTYSQRFVLSQLRFWGKI
jgi:hypothetical protein